MKRFIVLLLALLPVLSLSSSVLAASNNTFYVNNAYPKDNDTYDIVVHDPRAETLRLYINDKKSVNAKVNKQGWATFQKVKLSGQSKLSFAKRVNLKYIPLNYVKYVSVDNKQVQLSDIGAKHSYDDFYTWLMGQLDIQSQMNVQASGFKDDTRYKTIIDVCAYVDSNFGPQWTTCMQKGYKDYLKPDTFVGDNWMGDYSTMVGLMNDAQGEKEWTGALSDSEKYKNDMQEARTIYGRLAVTN